MAARLWHKAPFIRLLAATAAGIVLQQQAAIPLRPLVICFGGCLVFILLYSLTNIRRRFRFSVINGLAVSLLFVSFGALLVWQKDVRNNAAGLFNRYKRGNTVVVTLQEPLVEKANSYKALAEAVEIVDSSQTRTAPGSLIVYFQKDSALVQQLHYGSRLVLRKPLQEIKNTGNPGSFDYKGYCLFNGITHQVFLAKPDFVLLKDDRKNWLTGALFRSRAWVVDVLKKYIPGEKESGLAEALLIGYKDDLDKNLVQAYSNTGVVHIIAISGLHLGLIYALLVFLTRPLKRSRKTVWLRLLLVVGSLWAFSILAGGGPSVLRSAVMFSVIAVGEVALRRTNIFNTLACSALMLLCINPFWLWDVGFQLSYSAVLSIVLFYRPVYGWFSFPNKAVDFLWGLTAVTVSAQILTLPISIYHFHQLPLLFLFTNFVAVPLSSLVLMGEILLCAFAFFTPFAIFLGKILHTLIYWMNSYIEGLDGLPFSVWNGLSISFVQTVLLTVFALGFCFWLLEKQRRFAWTASSSLALFLLLRGLSFAGAYNQRKLIVYNVPKHPAMDIIAGRQYAFLGDSALFYDDGARNFHLQPSRILHRVTPVDAPTGTRFFALGEKEVVWLDEAVSPVSAEPRRSVDLLVLSRSPRLSVASLANAFALKQVVIDGSVPAWRAARWKRECDSLHIACTSVSEDGAFVLNW